MVISYRQLNNGDDRERLFKSIEELSAKLNLGSSVSARQAVP
jgi:hypothetical protein